MTHMQTLTGPSPVFRQVATLLREIDPATLSPDIKHTAALYILDLIGVLFAGSKMDAARIAREHAVKHWAAGPGVPSARLLLDGRSTSLPGFGFAMATQIDNLDAHDGWQPSKGHAGAALFPALCAFAEAESAVSGPEALTCMILGYEISYRAASALHGTVSDYHTSGAWNSIGCAAIGARLRNLSDEQFRHAIGIAEYHGPRSQMMREIANPTMLHDGTGWGAPTGIYATLIAEDGFWGAPAATIEFDDAAFAWSDLGERWLTMEQYIKPYPVCRWAHGAIDAARSLVEEHNPKPEDIARISIHTFVNSAALNNDVPTSSPQAQYSLAWNVAAMLARRRVGVDEVLEESFADPVLQALTAKSDVSVNPDYEANFPIRRTASVSLTLNDGRTLNSGPTEPSGGPDPQPTETEVVEKFRTFAGTVLSVDRVERIVDAGLELTRAGANFKDFVELLVDPA